MNTIYAEAALAIQQGERSLDTLRGMIPRMPANQAIAGFDEKMKKDIEVFEIDRATYYAHVAVYGGMVMDFVESKLPQIHPPLGLSDVRYILNTQTDRYEEIDTSPRDLDEREMISLDYGAKSRYRAAEYLMRRSLADADDVQFDLLTANMTVLTETILDAKDQGIITLETGSMREPHLAILSGMNTGTTAVIRAIDYAYMKLREMNGAIEPSDIALFEGDIAYLARKIAKGVELHNVNPLFKVLSGIDPRSVMEPSHFSNGIMESSKRSAIDYNTKAIRPLVAAEDAANKEMYMRKDSPYNLRHLRCPAVIEHNGVDLIARVTRDLVGLSIALDAHTFEPLPEKINPGWL